MERHLFEISNKGTVVYPDKVVGDVECWSY